MGAREHAEVKTKHALSVVVQGAKDKVGRQKDVSLTAKVSWRGPKADLQYRWSSVEGPALPAGADESATTLRIPASELEAGSRYHLRFRVVAEWKDDEGEAQSSEATSEVKFEVNSPPRGGKCTLETRYVGRAQAILTLGAPGWKDDDQVQYRYMLLRNGKETLVHNWSQSLKRETASIARVGDTLQAKCGIRDKFGDGLVALSQEVTRSAAD
jgi:hypothetical protein